MSKNNNYQVSSAYGKYFHHVVKTILRLRICFISFSIFSIMCQVRVLMWITNGHILKDVHF